MPRTATIRTLTHGMANALLAGEWSFEQMNARLADALGRRWRWRRVLVRHLLKKYASPPAYGQLADAIASDTAFCKAINDCTCPRIVHWFLPPSTMQPAFPAWGLPPIDTTDALGRLLELTDSQLRWLADCERRRSRYDDCNHQHYRTYWLPKPTGGWRLVEAPHYLLKCAQRRLLHAILDLIPPHPAACAFRRSRSIADYASAHMNKAIVLHLDLRNFFPSIPVSRVHAMLTTLGYPGDVARLMTGLCTSAVPLRLCRQHEGGMRYSSPHLPQGAPTSPALANLAAFRLDCRLTAAAECVGATYTRYADDLAFSGEMPFAHGLSRFQSLVWRIIDEEGFDVNHRKTRVMHKCGRQRLCGLVVNAHLNIDRRYYDRLKAILTNCLRHGLDTQNREQHPHFREHLNGRVAYVEQINPARGARLRSMFDSIIT
jgi:RNA-directed DNA polymerase